MKLKMTLLNHNMISILITIALASFVGFSHLSMKEYLLMEREDPTVFFQAKARSDRTEYTPKL